MNYFIKLLFIIGLMLLNACAQQHSQEDSDIHTTEHVPNKNSMEIIETPSPDTPIWNVGDTWRYSDGYELKVSSIAGEEITFQRIDSEDWLVRRNLFKVRSKQGNTYRETIYRTKNPDELFPLAVGKQVVYSEEYLRDGELIRRNTSWTVEGIEAIQVPAGTFNCWILVMRTRSIQSDWTGMERWWYNPDIKHYARMEYRYGTAPAGARVLINYKLN